MSLPLSTGLAGDVVADRDSENRVNGRLWADTSTYRTDQVVVPTFINLKYVFLNDE